MTVPISSESWAAAGWTIASGEKRRAIQARRPRPRARELRDERAIVDDYERSTLLQAGEFDKRNKSVEDKKEGLQNGPGAHRVVRTVLELATQREGEAAGWGGISWGKVEKSG